MKVEKLIPDMVADSIEDVGIDYLISEDVKYVLIDVDNTIAPWNSSEISQKVLKWVKDSKSAGLKLFIVTNGQKKRVDEIAGQLGVECFKSAGKPRLKAMRRILARIGAEASSAALIGDQLFTDILAANRAGMKSVLVTPISDVEWWATRLFNRTRERAVWNKVFPEGKPKE